MLLDNPIPFREALQKNNVRRVLPTNMSSAELREIEGNIHRTSFTSAKTYLDDYLAAQQNEIGQLLRPQTEIRPEAVSLSNPHGAVTIGPNPTNVRLTLKMMLQDLGYSAPEGKAGTIEDLSSDARINLIVETQTAVAKGYGQWRQGQDEDVLDRWPAQELYRLSDAKVPREWHERWLEAAGESGDETAASVLESTGRMVARKDSGIWQALGDGAGGHDDSLGNPFPPFAFNSGMDVQDIDRDEAVELGVIGPDEQVKPQEDAFAVETEAA